MRTTTVQRMTTTMAIQTTVQRTTTTMAIQTTASQCKYLHEHTGFFPFLRNGESVERQTLNVVNHRTSQRVSTSPIRLSRLIPQRSNDSGIVWTPLRAQAAHLSAS